MDDSGSKNYERAIKCQNHWFIQETHLYIKHSKFELRLAFSVVCAQTPQNPVRASISGSRSMTPFTQTHKLQRSMLIVRCCRRHRRSRHHRRGTASLALERACPVRAHRAELFVVRCATHSSPHDGDDDALDTGTT